jgi:uncharacterized protein
MANENRDEQGQFTEGSEAARKAGRKGSEHSSGSFKNDPERAREAGRKGGQNSGNRNR